MSSSSPFPLPTPSSGNPVDEVTRNVFEPKEVENEGELVPKHNRIGIQVSSLRLAAYSGQHESSDAVLKMKGEGGTHLYS